MPGLHPAPSDIVGQIVSGVFAALDRASERSFRHPPRKRGATVRPGPATPAWNNLALAIRPLLRRRGAKALLARELGLPRGRMTDYFVTHRVMPDAEHTLRLLRWYARKIARPPAADVRNTNISPRPPAAGRPKPRSQTSPSEPVVRITNKR